MLTKSRLLSRSLVEGGTLILGGGGSVAIVITF